MKTINFPLYVLMLYGCAAPSSISQMAENKHIENATIVTVERPPYYSGYVKTWVKIVAALASQESIIIYLPYMSKEQKFPPVGSLCSMTTQKEYLDGISIDGSLDKVKPLLAPSSMECDGKIYRY